MSASETLEQTNPAEPNVQHKRKVVNAFWQPFLQFKLLMYMLGTTTLVAVLLGAFLYYAFSDLVTTLTVDSGSQSYYAEMIDIQLIYLFRYCGALFVLYVLLLAAVCVAYTHKLTGPFLPFKRHVDALTSGDYSSRVQLRAGDLEMFTDYAAKLNDLAASLEQKEKADRKQQN